MDGRTPADAGCVLILDIREWKEKWVMDRWACKRCCMTLCFSLFFSIPVYPRSVYRFSAPPGAGNHCTAKKLRHSLQLQNKTAYVVRSGCCRLFRYFFWRNRNYYKGVIHFWNMASSPALLPLSRDSMLAEIISS